MKVLYVASQAPEGESLELEREITALQARLPSTIVEAAQFTFLPDVKLEDFVLEISKYRPDVLHISVHGSKGGLWFGTSDGRAVELLACDLKEILPPNHRPKLILLNACDSDKIAEYLGQFGMVAMGTTAPITNQAAITGATTLYDRLLRGSTIRSAFLATDAFVRTLEEGKLAFRMFSADPELPNAILYHVPQIVAKLPSDQSTFNKKGDAVRIYIGLNGCPPSAGQVVFFTDDPSFIKDDEDLENGLTEVIRDQPRRGEVWTETTWEVDGDSRVAACGLTGSGETFAACSSIADALERYVQITEAPQPYLDALPAVTKFLRDRDGSGLRDWKPYQPRTPGLPPGQSVRPRIRK